MPEVSAAIDGRSKKGSRTWNFRQDRNNFVRGLELRYVRRLEAILEFYSWRSMVILTFVRLIKQGSVIISKLSIFERIARFTLLNSGEEVF